MSKLNKIEGYCLEVLKKSQKFLSDPKNDDYIDVNTHHERSEMAKDILKIIKVQKLNYLKNKKCRTCRTKCKFIGMNFHGRGYDQDGNDIDELLSAYLQN